MLAFGNKKTEAVSTAPATVIYFFFLRRKIPTTVSTTTTTPAAIGIVRSMSPVLGTFVPFPGVTLGESYMITCWISLVSSTLNATLSATS